MHGYESSSRRAVPRPTRRTFVKGLAMGGVLGAVDLWTGTAWAQPAKPQPSPALTGSTFDLRIGESLVNFTGATRVAHTVNGSLPAPALRWREGDTVTVRVCQHAARRSHIHSLARHRPAREHGWRSGSELQRHRSGRDVRLPVSCPASWHVLVPQPFGRFRSRSGCTGRSSSSRASRSRSATTASTS